MCFNYNRANHVRAVFRKRIPQYKSDAIALVFKGGENSRTLFRVCRSWQCMYVLTILTMAERDVGNENDSDGRSITSRMDGERSRRCDREPIISRRRSISIHRSSCCKTVRSEIKGYNDWICVLSLPALRASIFYIANSRVFQMS